MSSFELSCALLHTDIIWDSAEYWITIYSIFDLEHHSCINTVHSLEQTDSYKVSENV